MEGEKELLPNQEQKSPIKRWLASLTTPSMVVKGILGHKIKAPEQLSGAIDRIGTVSPDEILDSLDKGQNSTANPQEK